MSSKGTVSVTLPYTWQSQNLQQLLHCGEDNFLMQRSRELYDGYGQTFRPSFAVREVDVRLLEDHLILVENAVFHSEIAHQQLAQTDQVLLYIATCGGGAVEQLSPQAEQSGAIGQGLADADTLMDQFLLKQLGYNAYLQAMCAMQDWVARYLDLEQAHFRILCPGSVPDWSVRENFLIYRILETQCSHMGVNVFESGMISPLCSTAGVIYVTEDDFESCNICMRSHCETRRAPFDFQRYVAARNF